MFCCLFKGCARFVFLVLCPKELRPVVLNPKPPSEYEKWRETPEGRKAILDESRRREESLDWHMHEREGHVYR